MNPIVRWHCLLIAVLCLGPVFLTGCVTTNQQVSASVSAEPEMSSLIREVDLSPRSAKMVSENQKSSGSVKPSRYYGADESGPAGTSGARSRRATDSGPEITGALPHLDDKGYEHNIESTPVTTTAKAVLGDILGYSYTIDPREQ